MIDSDVSILTALSIIRLFKKAKTRQNGLMLLKKLSHSLVLLGLMISAHSCSHTAPLTSGSEVSRAPSEATTQRALSKVFEDTRNLLLRQNDPELAALAKNISESVLVEELQTGATIPKNLAPWFRELALKSAAEALDPAKHTRLRPLRGQNGYDSLQLFVSHPHFRDKKLLPASNLLETWKSFLAQAKRQIILNVYEFDIMEIAELLAAKANEGVEVTVGIDSNVLQEKEAAAKVFRFLKSAHVDVVSVDSTNLNHQKMVAIDWDDPTEARVLFSSGNLTHSCLDPKGDFWDLPDQNANAIPNANNLITLRSFALAQLVHHELTKSLSAEFLLRGAEFPRTGSYLVTGPDIEPSLRDSFPENSLLIAFTPKGANGSVQQNLFSDLIEHTSGPVYLAQFAFSSEIITAALLKKAQKLSTTSKPLELFAVGDSGSIGQGWNQFLALSGWKIIKDSNDKTVFQDDAASSWRALFGKKYQRFRKNIKMAPPVYDTRNVQTSQGIRELAAKVHHKLLVIGPYTSVGTSFNLSAAAESNSEQIIITRDSQLATDSRGIVEWLLRQSPKSVNEALRSFSNAKPLPR